VHLPIDLLLPEGLLEKPLQPVECQVRQRRRDDSAPVVCLPPWRTAFDFPWGPISATSEAPLCQWG
jgi:hypothetical protein